MANTQHVSITDPNIHEPKGATTASDGEVLFSSGAGATEFRPLLISDVDDLDLAGASAGDVFTADGVGSGAMVAPVPPAGSVVQGVYNYDDEATSITPIALTVVDTNYVLTNDTLGAQTLKFPMIGLTEMWDGVTNEFIWTEGAVLALGDSVDLRVDLLITTTSVNTEITVELCLDCTGLNIPIAIIPEMNFPSTGTHHSNRFTSIFMGVQAILDGPANLVARSSKTGTTVEVNGWYLRPLHTVA